MPLLDYHAPKQYARRNCTFFALSSCAVGLAGNALGMLAASTLRHVPPGSSIRPMGLAALLFLIAAVTAALGITLVAVALGGSTRVKRRALFHLIVVLGALLSLSPIVSSRWVWNRIELRNRLMMEP